MAPNLKPPLPVQVGSYAGTLRIHRDARGVAWIDDSNTKVVEVIQDHARGYSAERIQEAHPHLSLPQIYAALAYYYDHKQEVDDLMRQWRGAYEEGFSDPDNTDWREKMRTRAAAAKPQRKEVVST